MNWVKSAEIIRFEAGSNYLLYPYCEMIDNSELCIVYYDEENAPTTRKSGTKTALDYAIKKGKEIINVV